MRYRVKQLLKNVIPEGVHKDYRLHWNKFNRELTIVYGKFVRLFTRPQFPKLDNGATYLHLGCGSVNHPKFINIDGIPAPHIHYVRSIENLSPFEDNSVDLVYACHCLEHFPYATVPKVVAEWFRVLKQGGILRLSVPDFDLLLNIYNNNEKDVNTILSPLMGGQNYKFNFHLTVFTHSSLETILKNAGFRIIQKWQPGSCELTTFDDFSDCKVLRNFNYYPVSLNLEAIK